MNLGARLDGGDNWPNRPMILPNRHFVYPAQVEEVERGAGGAGSAGGRNAVSGHLRAGFRDPKAPTGYGRCPIRTGFALFQADTPI